MSSTQIQASEAYLTMIGASANIVSVGMAKKFGVTISFFEYFKKSVLITLMTLVLSSVYIVGYLWVSL
jgi:Na+/H+ antiporter NhaD/arsenite permease-like protein